MIYPVVTASGYGRRPRRRKAATGGNAGHPSLAGASFQARRRVGLKFRVCSGLWAREYDFWNEAAEVDAVMRTAAEPDAFGACYPGTFGDVLGLPARYRYGTVCPWL